MNSLAFFRVILLSVMFAITVSATAAPSELIPGEMGFTGIRPGTVERCEAARTPLEEFGYAWEMGFPYSRRNIGMRLAEPSVISSAKITLVQMNPDGIRDAMSTVETQKRFQVWVSDDNASYRPVKADVQVKDSGTQRIIEAKGINTRCRYIKFVCDRDSKWCYGSAHPQQMIELRAAPRENGNGDHVVLVPDSVRSPIQIDGQFNESTWQKANQHLLNYTLVSRTMVTTPNTGKTGFAVAADMNFIYLSIRCDAATATVASTPKTSRNNSDIFKTDRIELFLSPDKEKKVIYQLAVNAAGAITELLNGSTCNDLARVVVMPVSSGYQIEIAIDRKKLQETALVYLDSLGSEVSSDFWYFNLCREQPSQPEKERYCSWIYTGDNFQNPDAMGMLVLEPPSAVLIKVLAAAENSIASRIKKAGVQMTVSDGAEVTKLKEQLFKIAASQRSMEEQLKKSSDSATEKLTTAMAFTRQNLVGVDRLLEELKIAAFNFSAEKQKLGYVWYQVPVIERPSPKRLPTERELIDELVFSLAGDEGTYRRFSLFAGREFHNVELSWEALKDNAGHQIPASDIDVRQVEQWGPPEDADILSTDQRIKLDGWLKGYAAAPRFVTKIPAKSSKHFIVKIYAAPKQSPGKYTGKISIRFGDNAVAELPLQVTVLPFDLKRSERDLGFFYTGNLPIPGGPAIGTYWAWRYNGLTTEEAMFREFRSLVKDGFNKMVIKDYAQGPIDPAYTTRMLKIAAAAGLRKISLDGANEIPGMCKVNPKNAGEKQEHETACRRLGDNLKTIAIVSRRLGIDLCVFGFDEPRNDEMLAVCRAICREAVKAGLKTDVTCIYEDTARKLPEIDHMILLYSHNMSSPEFLEKVRTGRSGYRSLMYYANTMGNQLNVVRLAFGWHLYKNNFQGNLPYAYYDLQYDWEPFLQRIPKRGASVAYYVFPTLDEPIPTLKYVAAQEGVNDLRYLETLDAGLKKCSDPAKAAKIRAEMNKMLEKFEATNSGGAGSRNFMLPEGVYDQLRDEIQQLLLKLENDK